jgi:hypothetical protein
VSARSRRKEYIENPGAEKTPGASRLRPFLPIEIGEAFIGIVEPLSRVRQLFESGFAFLKVAFSKLVRLLKKP